jgi:hypothetical protein
MSDELTPEFELPTEQERQPLDRMLEMTLRYNYRRDLREANKPSLYGPGMDFYEEQRIREEQQHGW